MGEATTIEIRRAGPADARAVAEVHVGSWRHAYRGLLPDGYLDRLSVEEREGTWREALGGASIGAFVGELGGRVVGFASFGPSRDGDAGRDVGEIPAIYVEPSALGTGVGRELLGAATEALRRAGFTRATLWVLEANEPARRFYEKAGWRWDGPVSRHDFDCANEPVVRYAVQL
ncbi:MAG TPA: GNAT family N-acetyltransferase [Actinomycetota bacterium]|nr:GNAT family N-acetyltransferase [Actinomycetota bacterium]